MVGSSGERDERRDTDPSQLLNEQDRALWERWLSIPALAVNLRDTAQSRTLYAQLRTLREQGRLALTVYGEMLLYFGVTKKCIGEKSLLYIVTAPIATSFLRVSRGPRRTPLQ